MTQLESGQVLDLHARRMRSIGQLTEEQIWHSVQRRILQPAWRFCRQQVETTGREVRLQEPEPEPSRRPFTVLYWQGADALEGHLIGLQVGIPASGKLRLDLGLVREGPVQHHQTSAYREVFHLDQPDLAAHLLHASSYATGLAMAIERSPLEAARWEAQVPPPERLC